MSACSAYLPTNHVGMTKPVGTSIFDCHVPGFGELAFHTVLPLLTRYWLCHISTLLPSSVLNMISCTAPTGLRDSLGCPLTGFNMQTGDSFRRPIRYCFIGGGASRHYINFAFLVQDLVDMWVPYMPLSLSQGAFSIFVFGLFLNVWAHSTCLEKHWTLGGMCLNIGCISSKTTHIYSMIFRSVASTVHAALPLPHPLI